MQRATVAPLVLPPLVLLGALGLSLAPLLTQHSDRPVTTLIAVAGFGVVAVVVILKCLTNLGLGVSLIPFVASAVPFTIGTGTQSAIVAGLVFTGLLLGLWILQKTFGRDLRFVKSAVNGPILALVGVWALAYLASDVDVSPMVWLWSSYTLPRVGQLAIVIFSAVAFLLALNHGRNERHLKIATWSFVILGVLAVAAFYAGHEGAFGFLSTGGLFSMWGVTLAYGQALFNATLPRWLRVGLVGMVVAWIVKAMIFQTLWFSGWVPMVVTFAVLTLIRSPRGFIALAGAAAAMVLAERAVVYHALWDAKVQEGDLSRLPIWQQSLGLVQNHPLLGTGPAGYAPYYQTIYAASSYSMSTHSNYLDFVAQTGLIGVAIALWFLVTLLVVGWQARRRWRSGFRGGFAQATFAGFVGLLVAMSLGDWFIPFVYNQTIAGFRFTVQSWVFLGYMASLATIRPPGEDS
jgi:hypothetical protein